MPRCPHALPLLPFGGVIGALLRRRDKSRRCLRRLRPRRVGYDPASFPPSVLVKTHLKAPDGLQPGGVRLLLLVQVLWVPVEVNHVDGEGHEEEEE